MWLFTTFGFFSIVQKQNNSFLTVRARASADLDRLRQDFMPELSETLVGGGTDYPYRATINHEDFSRGLAKLGEALDYSNFKAEVHKKMGYERASIYGDVWSALLKLERIKDQEFDR